MRQKWMKLLFTMVIVFFISVVPYKISEAEDFKVSYTSGDITSNVTYEINEDGETVTLKNYSSSTTDTIGINIPKTVTYDGKKYTITALADSAFYYETNLVMVEIPETVKIIGKQCFNGCKKLQKVTFTGDGLEIIEGDAFFGCALESFSIPSTVTTIGGGAFGYAQFSEIVIPKSVTTCGKNVFYAATELKKITFEEGFTTIPEWFLYGCNNINTIVLPSTLKTIETYGLANDGTIETLTLPASLEKIGYRAFYGSTIKKLVVECDSAQIENGAMAGCKVKELHCSKYSSIYKEYEEDDDVKIVLTGTYMQQDNIELKFGETTQLIIMNPIGATTWTTSDPAVATVSNEGVVQGVGSGKAVITAVNNGVTMTCNVTVKPFELNYTKRTIGIGSTLKLTTTAVGNVTWKSSNKKVATVNSKGVVTAKKKGSAKITATVAGTTVTCKITVKTNERKNLEKYPKKASAYPKNIAAFGFTKIKRDSKGNYIINGHFLNNYSETGTYLKNLTITVYKDGKKIAKQKYSRFKIKAPANSIRPVTIKIKKSKITKKTTDLRNGKITIKVGGGTLYR